MSKSPLLHSNHLSGSLPRCLRVCSGVDRELPTLYHGRLSFAFSLLHSPCEYFGSLPPAAQMRVLDRSHGEPGTEDKENLGCLWMKMRLEDIRVDRPRVCSYRDWDQKTYCSRWHNAGGCYLGTGPEYRLMAKLETLAYWKHLLFSSASHMICQNVFLVHSQLRTACYEV